ncbi:WGxxGxxG family protein [Paenibacillus sp. NPDC057967]|uniref:WGxxGxxG family protein n=1 Tax=Paenibacillus sp. NPDC057967 TaxID=3346293 RepID=UPI0036D8AB20
MKRLKLYMIGLSLMLAVAAPVYAASSEEDTGATTREVRQMQLQAERAKALRSPGYQQRSDLNSYSMTSVPAADKGPNWNWLGLLGLLGLTGLRRRNRKES